MGFEQLPVGVYTQTADQENWDVKLNEGFIALDARLTLTGGSIPNNAVEGSFVGQLFWQKPGALTGGTTPLRKGQIWVCTDTDGGTPTGADPPLATGIWIPIEDMVGQAPSGLKLTYVEDDASTPNVVSSGTLDVDGLTWLKGNVEVGDGESTGVIASRSTENLVLQTNNLTGDDSTGSFTITAQDNGDILISPHGTGNVVIASEGDEAAAKYLNFTSTTNTAVGEAGIGIRHLGGNLEIKNADEEWREPLLDFFETDFDPLLDNPNKAENAEHGLVNSAGVSVRPRFFYAYIECVDIQHDILHRGVGGHDWLVGDMMDIHSSLNAWIHNSHGFWANDTRVGYMMRATNFHIFKKADGNFTNLTGNTPWSDFKVVIRAWK